MVKSIVLQTLHIFLLLFTGQKVGYTILESKFMHLLRTDDIYMLLTGGDWPVLVKFLLLIGGPCCGRETGAAARTTDWRRAEGLCVSCNKCLACSLTSASSI